MISAETLIRSVRVGTMPADESQLVADLRAGRREAFDRMVEIHYDRLHRLASTMTGSPEDAADLVQETFLAAMKSAVNFRGDARLSTWLIAILRNQYTLYLRGRKKWRFAPLDAAGGARAAETGPAVKPEVTAILERVRRLPEELRTALVLFYLEGMRYHEIAEAMECPVGTVRSRLFEARERLKKMMEGAKP
jgi:RNA polymerase sigma-70 factor (ECF subfamily)